MLLVPDDSVLHHCCPSAAQVEPEPGANVASEVITSYDGAVCVRNLHTSNSAINAAIVNCKVFQIVVIHNVAF